MKRYWKIAGIVIGVLSVVLNMFLAALLLQRFNREEDTLLPMDPAFAAMLEDAGLRKDSILYLKELGFNMGRQFKVFQATTEDGALVLAYAEKSEDSGTWEITRSESTTEAVPYIRLAWFGDTQTRKYNRWDTKVTETEWHYAYCGNDAVKAIVLDSEQLPENVAVNIRQEGRFYLIHVVVYAVENFSLDVRAVLEENGCVKPIP